MAKGKRLTERLRVMYKGTARRSPHVTNDSELATVHGALKECLPKRFDYSFRCDWMGRDADMRVVVGLSAGLRHLKRGQTRALILDSTASQHLMNLLTAFSEKRDLPTVIADKLLLFAPQVNLKTLLLVSLVDASPQPDENLYKEKDPRPKCLSSSIELESFRGLVNLLETAHRNTKEARDGFRSYKTISIKSSGKSQVKKSTRKGAKLAAMRAG